MRLKCFVDKNLVVDDEENFKRTKLKEEQVWVDTVCLVSAINLHDTQKESEMRWAEQGFIITPSFSGEGALGEHQFGDFHLDISQIRLSNNSKQIQRLY